MKPTRRPKLEILSSELAQQIIEEALLLLEKHGVFVENEEALELLRSGGAEVDSASQRVCFPRKLVEESLRQAPAEITLYDQTGTHSYLVGQDEVHFNPGSAAVTILDWFRQEQRKPLTRDVVRFICLTDKLPALHFQSTGIIASDVPEEVADSYRLYLALIFSAKPVVTGTFREESFRVMKEMLEVIRDDTASLREKPLAIFDACPSPPLKWSRLTAQSLIDSAHLGIPSEIISMGMTGATSPVTLAGTLVQHVAENLSGLVIAQLAQPGAPVIFGGSPSSFDMRQGTTPMGAIETMMIDSAYAQIGKQLNLPTHAYMALSDAKTIDAQAGLESGIGAVLAALSGINVISGPGMLDFESCQSLEKLLVDHEICQMAYRLIEGIAQRDEPLALDLFAEITPNSQFLTLEHTRRWYREEHLFLRLIDRTTYGDWVRAGKKRLAEKAHEEVEKLLREAEPCLQDETKLAELQKIMLREAKRFGLTSLPDLHERLD